ncbi:hypothetical protein SPRG_01486 [Saprolegnia parasitica CBS 223.65]|uniref:Glucose-methanol-choline oxidoreductase N-terminal domain-containing protein n=1 Tax=Saprolegnia parasitica (strain CBS 223.65) TaxID=695850 RepID=A0A067CYL5_SAPPC|nr:hypothetical protein SPRG_01486 [Saprolegnia parasitica CBS 223.65]KDO34350.1 hypothetical protein SPRG_01486 [Saprolegnia parasitica CBS 223.65]|eukprot:XP_012195086.1 hypothetical protein SPRG_01486 [Saprolegnia parasitica CBS 223.65]
MGNTTSYGLALLSLGVAMADTYDVIVVGSGPGGLVAAEYLSRNASLSVLVLEAGLPTLAASGGNNFPSYAQANGLTVFDIPGEYTNIAFGGNAAYRYGTDWVSSPTGLYLGKCVGGSSSLNGMLYFRTPDSYVTEASWPNDVATVNAGFSAIETMFTATNNPSPDGVRYNQQAYNIMRSVLGSGGGYTESSNLNNDRNAKSKSYGHPPFAIKNGLRDSPAKTFLGVAKARSNFKLISSATVSYIIQSKGTATGVVYTTGGQTVTASLSGNGAVIVAGGAAMTPKILMQSGVGPSSQLNLLKSRGNSPGVSGDAANWVVNENVGDSMFDSQQLLMTFSRNDMVTFSYSQSQTAAITQYMTQGRSGPWASPDPILIAYENYNFNNRAYQFQVTAFTHGFNWGSNSPTEFGVAVYVNNPISRDSARFSSDGGYRLDTARSLYSNPTDRAAVANYLDKLRGWMSSQGVTQVVPNAGVSSMDFVNANIQGANHYGGSCYASGDGSDAKRCADETLRVVGTKNIFVGDASLMKTGTVNPYGFIMYAGYQTGVNVAKAIASGSTTPVTPPGSCSNLQSDLDYYGNDIKSTSRASATDCCGDCAATAGCALYVWTGNNGGTCWLKNAAGAPSSKPGAKSGFRGTVTTPPVTTTPPPAGSCTNLQSDLDYFGNDIKSTSRASANDCCADCAATTGCVLYVWTNTAGGTCWLKNAAGPSSSKPGAKSGFTTSPPLSSCGAPLANTDFDGQDVANVPGGTPAVCCAACQSNPACNAYSIWNNICWLKSGSNAPRSALGVVAATVNKCSALESDVDYFGNDLGSAPAAAATGCCALCRNRAGCKSFSWFQGVCYLKSAKGASSTKTGVISAVVIA